MEDEMKNRQPNAQRRSWILCILAICLAGIVAATPLWSQEKKEISAEELAKKSQNPVEPMISVPFQNNVNFGYGPNNNTQNLLNIQPVIPISLSKELNLITRTIIPVINQPWPEQKFGLGDINISLFLSPAKPNKVLSGNFVWGAGPILQFPSATGEVLGAGKWAAGPAAVGVYMNGPWVVGVLANNLWSYAGEGSRSTVNQFLTQPFINYNLPHGWFLFTSPIITANWVADSASDIWTVPVGAGAGKVFKIGKQSFSGSASYFYNVAKPAIVGPDWTLRIALTFLFPE